MKLTDVNVKLCLILYVLLYQGILSNFLINTLPDEQHFYALHFYTF